MSEKVLSAVADRLERNLKKQVQNNLAEIFNMSSCKAVAREIKAGRNVTGNAEFGIRMCIHNKVAPRVDPSTLRFYPMTAKSKRLEERFIETTNDMLEAGGFPKMSPNLLSNMRKKDRAFERDIAARRKKRKSRR